jgi:hypothetical protein
MQINAALRRDGLGDLSTEARPGKLKDRFENSVDLVFQLGSKPRIARLVVIDLVIDLRDRESMDSKVQRFARAARRRRTWARYSSRRESW